MRNTIVILTVAALLACPYDCTAKLASSLAVHGEKTGRKQDAACCQKCRIRQSTSPLQDNTPGTPVPEEDGRCCLCEGALLGAGPVFPLADSTPIALPSWNASPSEIHDAGAQAARFDVGSPPPPWDGRQLRIVICSMLL